MEPPAVEPRVGLERGDARRDRGRQLELDAARRLFRQRPRGGGAGGEGDRRLPWSKRCRSRAAAARAGTGAAGCRRRRDALRKGCACVDRRRPERDKRVDRRSFFSGFLRRCGRRHRYPAACLQGSGGSRLVEGGDGRGGCSRRSAGRRSRICRACRVRAPSELAAAVPGIRRRRRWRGLFERA